MNKVESLLSDAIKKNKIVVVSSLITNGSADVNTRIGGEKNTMLVVAARHGRAEIVALLLDLGARIDDSNATRETACHVAVRNGCTAVVKLLVARNANVSLRNGFGQMPINIAIDNKNERLVMLLVDAAMASGMPLDNETTCLAATVSADVIQLLLFKHQINLSAIRNHSGRTPLHEAVGAGGTQV